MIPDAMAARRWTLQQMADNTPPHSTLRCWRVVTDGYGASYFCGAILVHVGRPGSMLTLCPECDNYHPEDER